MKKTAMENRIACFLRHRLDLGYTSSDMGYHLRSFVKFCKQQGHIGPPTMEIMQAWMRGKRAVRRWTSLRKFCEYCSLSEPATEIPAKILGNKPRPRVEPYIYTSAQIRALLKEARNLAPKKTNRGATFATYFGLLAATGMRPGEGMRMMPGDIDWRKKTISIRDSKGNRLRVIPVHSTVLQQLKAYAKIRSTIPLDLERSAFFLDSRLRKPLNLDRTHWAFHRCCDKAGISSPAGKRDPRPHDLRHTFACKHLLRICRQKGDANSSLLSLSAYLGHVSPKDTYWYLTGTPELFQLASKRFEQSVFLRREGGYEEQ